MRSGFGEPAARVAASGVRRRCSSVLLLGLAVSGCVGSGQIANLTEARRSTIGVESVDGPPSTVVHNFVKTLKDEAGAQQIAVVPPGEANYRLRGYLAAHGEGAATSISWALDVYDAEQHRAFRLSGEEKSSGRMWAAADDRVLHRIARAGIGQFAAFLATAGPTAARPQRTSSAFDWLDDWAPEASGIFRTMRSEPSRPEIAADAEPPLRADEVPLPRGRPPGGNSDAAFAFAPED